jgi:Rrf2 family nitric oxide-sensitive transcriptional repressor
VQLTLHADYALRVLLYLASHPDRTISTSEIGKAYGISKHHLVRVVQRLNEHGFVAVTPGRFGGASLARPAHEINVGTVVRSTETNLSIVECFNLATNTCVIAPVCRLKGILHDALRSFMSVLDGYTLADLVDRGGAERLALTFARSRKVADHSRPVRA